MRCWSRVTGTPSPRRWTTPTCSWSTRRTTYGPQAVPFGPGATRTLMIVAAMVVLLAAGAVPPAVAGLLAAGALIVSRVITVDHAYHSINWTTIVLIAGMIPLSTAMRNSGAADDLADGIIRVSSATAVPTCCSSRCSSSSRHSGK